jgi:Flp pilus assembly pilin Flp
MIERIVRILRSERGAETLEWILIGGIIVIVGTLVYGPAGPLKTALDSAINTVAGTLKAGAGS